jgi:small neutral amino acid transporter SnatA (MarC family)
MLTYIYNHELDVEPFFIVPVAIAASEAAVILGPHRSSVQNGELIRQLYGRIAERNLSDKIIVQVLPFDGLMLIANTIQTSVPDMHSGRYGLKLTYGALIKRKVFLEHSDVCTRVFSLFNTFLNKSFGASTGIKGAEQIVAYFQQYDRETGELLNQREADAFIDKIKSEFHAQQSRNYSIIKRIRLSNRNYLKKLKLLEPVPTVEEAAEFWRMIDETIHSTFQGALLPGRDNLQLNKYCRGLVVGSLLSLLFSTGFVELIGWGARTDNIWLGLLLFCVSLYSYLVPGLFVIYAIKRSFSKLPKKQMLLTIVISYFSLIFIFAGMYYSMEALSDYNIAVREYNHYHYEGDAINIGLLARPRPFSKDQRALKGLEGSLWSGVKNIEDTWEIYKDPDPSLEKFWIRNAQRPIDKVIRFQPEERLPIFGDCLHFSVMTMITVGYGDITPGTWYAKLTSDLQAIAGVVLFVVALGMLFGNWQEDRSLKVEGKDTIGEVPGDGP